MSARLLNRDEIAELVDAAVAAGLTEPGVRSLLFAGLPPAYAPSLSRSGSSLDQLWHDLNDLAIRDRLIGHDEPPLLMWLRNAEDLRSPRSTAEIFRRFRERLEPARPPAAHASPLPGEPSRQADVLLLCAMKDEYDQVLQVTDGLLEPWQELPDGPRRWTRARATFSTATGPLIVHASWANQMGRESMQAVVSLFLTEQAPRCLAMSGICAGRRGKVSLGDVIFADRLWSYDAGKTVVEQGHTRFLGDQLQYRPPAAWTQRMQSLVVAPDAPWLAERPAIPLEHQEMWVLQRLAAGEDARQHPDRSTACPAWSEVLDRLWKQGLLARNKLTATRKGLRAAEKSALLHPDGIPPPPAFKTHVAPIATGAAVVEDTSIFDRLAKDMRKVLGIEMEAAGLAAVADLHELPVLVAKAAADHGDTLKDDRYRSFAARASAECLLQLLRNGADLLPGRAPNRP